MPVFPLRAEPEDLVRFVVPGRPVPKGRPRTRVVKMKGKAPFATIYTPSNTIEYEKDVARLSRLEMKGTEATIKPVSVSVVAVFPIPKSVTKKRLAAIEAGFEPCNVAADLDNVVKSITDAMNKIVYADDAQIVRVSAQKLWGTEGQAIISVRELLAKDLLKT